MSCAELHCVSNFTFLRGASHPEELVARAQELGYAALAITDECSLAGIVRAHVEDEKCRLPLIVGSEFRLDDGLRLVLLATDRESYGRLSALITRGRRNGAAKGSYRLTLRRSRRRRRRLASRCGCPRTTPDVGRSALAGTRAFPAHCGSRPSACSTPTTRRVARSSPLIADVAGLPIVAAGDVHARPRAPRAAGHADRDPAQDVASRSRLRAASERRAPPAAARDAAPRLSRRMARRDARHRRTLSRFRSTSLRYEYPEEIVPPGETPTSYLRRLTEEGFAPALSVATTTEDRRAKVRKLIEHELALIAEAALRAVLPHRVRHRRIRAQQEHPLPGPRLGGQFGGLLLPRHHRGRSRRAWRCCSSASSRASATSRPTSTSTSSISGARR